MDDCGDFYPVPWSGEPAGPGCTPLDTASDPIMLFGQWLNQAWAAEPRDANAMALATCGSDGSPSVRTVFLENYGPDGFLFYTNIKSRKAEDLAANRRAALMFHWKALARQVRIEGEIAAVEGIEADIFFAGRERKMQLGAWSSEQSRLLPNRALLDARVESLDRLYAGMVVPRPPHWSGYRVAVERIEFWSAGPYRLHDRRLFTRIGDNWTSELLFP